MRLDIAALSDMGRRKKVNEDSYGVFREGTPGLRLFREGALVCVADGLGGHVGGEIASKLAVSIMKDALTEPAPPQHDEDPVDVGILNILSRYSATANTSVYKTNEDLGTGSKPMGTTLVSVVVTPKRAFVSNVGDSRCYHIRENEIIGRTADHSWVDEQVRQGLMSKSEAQVDFRRNVVTRSIGTRPEVDVDTYVWYVVPGDWLLLCTDGLINMVGDAEVVKEFQKGGSAAEIASRLVHLANENGGKDNITIVLANISPNLFRLLLLKARAFVRKQGLKLLWLLVTIAAAAGGFVAGYFTKSWNLL